MINISLSKNIIIHMFLCFTNKFGSSKQIIKLRERLNKILAKNTGQNFTKVEKDVERDYYMTADEAKKYGVVDEIIEKAKNGK